MTHPLTGSQLSRRRLLGLGGGLAAAATLAACGGNTGRPDPAAAPSGSSAGGPTLQQWYHQYGEAGTQEAVKRYAASYPDATVDVTWKPGDYDQTVVATLVTDKAPDVFEYANGPTIDMIRSGQVADLTDVFGDALGDFNPALVKRVSHQGRIWAVPQVMDVQLLVYRTSMFTEAGVAPPTTIEELVEAAGTLTKGKVKGLFLGNDGGASLMGGPMLRSAGFDYLDDSGAFGFDDPAAAKALGVLRTLFTSGHLLLGAPNDWFAPDAFTQGLTAMQFTGLWNLPDIAKAVGDDFGVLPWPSMSGGSPNVTIGAYSSCVSAKSQDVDAAKQYVKWLWVDGADKQVDFATSYGLHVPARQSIAKQAEKLRTGPAAEAVTLAQRHGFAQSHLLWTPKSTTAFTDMMSRIVKNGADPAKEIAGLEKIVEAELARVKK
ncbi:ABC transporter substrate-binding protein [Mobilicoccus pelagius]|uniref:Putative sugar ABC transporter substrate-binding protein n=1 Tax=Mobilicoccus pelagius NBRC 104925 TaxID=1089455 RepID=H5UVR2_9MICO|nr:sugar ABC transporter substrate-binding protein [Mobilicoccus pelagius]GAB49820.1 putative sugar ABC transporter substrate-binding protein [Mobilicoccus pelagius NBRC 104925]